LYQDSATREDSHSQLIKAITEEREYEAVEHAKIDEVIDGARELLSAGFEITGIRG
jgi:hypothetical protein